MSLKRTISLYVFLLFIISLSGLSQIPTGLWRDHLPYKHGKQLAEYENKIFLLSNEGSLFSYSLNDGSIKKHSKVNGLSDSDISAIGTSEHTNTFLIAYKNGNIDLIRNDTIFNISDIKRKIILGEKSINKIYFINNYAYLACGFGIVVCDLLKREIKDTYFFGPNGTHMFVNDITSDNFFLYVATNSGIYKAELNNPNLLDFNSWTQVTSLPDPSVKYRFIVSYNNKVYTIYRNTLTEHDEVIVFDESTWHISEHNYADIYDYMGEQKGFLKISSPNKTKIYDNTGSLLKDEVTYYSQFALLDSKMRLWYAGAYDGLAMANKGLYIIPEGPAYRDVGDIEILSGNCWVAGGTFNSQWTNYGAYSFIDEKWKEYNRTTIPALEGFLNISEISIDPRDPLHVIGGSFGYGIAEFRNGQLTDIQDETDGVLEPVKGYENVHGYVRITGTDIDNEGTIYAAASECSDALYYKKENNNWNKLEVDYDGFGFNVVTGELIINSLGQVWLLIVNKGILVVKVENGIATRERFFMVKNDMGTLFDELNTITEDKDGNIWVGTNKGPVIYRNVENIFDEPRVNAYQPIIPRNDGTSYGSLLLSSEQINDIEVDGANRKWIATEKSGVFLISDDGYKEIYHFNEENSPLFSNSVQTIGVNDKTGEVMFGTEKGIVSFRGEATEGTDDFGDVYVFPNPVRENYNGVITITGLIKDANIKITDISGNLIYETTSLGGQAVWDGKNFRGDRVNTGIYLVFCTNEDGSKTFITKLLFIH